MSTQVDRMNIKQLSDVLKREARSMFYAVLQNVSGERDQESAIYQGLLELLDAHVAENGIQGYKITTELYWFDWAELYPKLSSRLLAQLAKAVGLKLEDSEKRWYHRVLPFKVETKDDDGFVDVMGVVGTGYRAWLPVPHASTIYTAVVSTILPAVKITLCVHYPKEQS